MKILVLVADRIFPTISAVRVRNRYLWPALSRIGLDVRVLALDLDRQNPVPAQGPPETWCKYIRPKQQGLLFRALGASLQSHHQWPPCPEFAEAVDAIVREWQPDVVHAEEVRMAAFLPAFRRLHARALQTLTLHNVESDLMRHTGSTTVPLAPRLFFALQRLSFQRFEDRAVSSADAVFAYSETDQARYDHLYPGRLWSVTTGGADVSGIKPPEPPHTQSALLLGSLDYAPNIRGIEWFISDVLPRLPESLLLTIAGRSPSPAFKAMIARTRIRIVDTPPAVWPLYADHAVTAIPLFEGGGTRGRILEALAHRRIVVTTKKGAEGLDLGAAEGVLVVESADAFAEAVVTWSTPSLERELRTLAGRQAVLDKYDWGVVAAHFADSLNRHLRRV